MKSALQGILDMSYSFSKIERDIWYPGRTEPENDAEHSLQLALIGWYIMEVDRLDLDKAKVFKLCIAHDLVELHAGDTPLFGKKGHEDKELREAKALDILKNDLNDASDITDAAREYRERKTPESVFVYGLDKLLPFLNQLNTEGKTWKNRKVTLERVLEVLEKQAVICPDLTKYFNEAIDYLKNNKRIFFNA